MFLKPSSDYRYRGDNLQHLASCQYTVNNNETQSRGGYSQKNWVGVCGPLPKTLTLFMTKICDFPYPIYDLTKNLIPYL